MWHSTCAAAYDTEAHMNTAEVQVAPLSVQLPARLSGRATADGQRT